MTKRLLYTFTLILALTIVGAASAQVRAWGWTASLAEDTLVSEYQTVDPWALKDAIVQTTLGLHPNVRAIAAAKRAARPEWAHCHGVGKHTDSYYVTFYCRIHLTSWVTNWEATRKVTLHVTGRDTFAVANGWH